VSALPLSAEGKARVRTNFPRKNVRFLACVLKSLVTEETLRQTPVFWLNDRGTLLRSTQLRDDQISVLRAETAIAAAEEEQEEGEVPSEVPFLQSQLEHVIRANELAENSTVVVADTVAHALVCELSLSRQMSVYQLDDYVAGFPALVAHDVVLFTGCQESLNLFLKNYICTKRIGNLRICFMSGDLAVPPSVFPATILADFERAPAPGLFSNFDVDYFVLEWCLELQFARNSAEKQTRPADVDLAWRLLDHALRCPDEDAVDFELRFNALNVVVAADNGHNGRFALLSLQPLPSLEALSCGPTGFDIVANARTTCCRLPLAAVKLLVSFHDAFGTLFGTSLVEQYSLTSPHGKALLVMPLLDTHAAGGLQINWPLLVDFLQAAVDVSQLPQINLAVARDAVILAVGSDPCYFVQPRVGVQQLDETAGRPSKRARRDLESSVAVPPAAAMARILALPVTSLASLANPENVEPVALETADCRLFPASSAEFTVWAAMPLVLGRLLSAAELKNFMLAHRLPTVPLQPVIAIWMGQSTQAGRDAKAAFHSFMKFQRAEAAFRDPLHGDAKKLTIAAQRPSSNDRLKLVAPLLLLSKLTMATCEPHVVLYRQGNPPSHLTTYQARGNSTSESLLQQLIGRFALLDQFAAARFVALVGLLSRPPQQSVQVRMPPLRSRMQDVYTAIGYEFISQDLAVCALTHQDCPKMPDNYERLEFLGDGVLEWLAARESVFLGVASPAVRASSVVENKALCVIALHLGLDKMIRSTPDKERRLQSKKGPDAKATKLLADVVEAMVGAIYLDSGGDLELLGRLFVFWRGGQS
jgi:hypothetical protein